MEIKFLGSTSETGDCPTVWETDHGTLLVQGEIVTDPAALAKVRTYGNGIPAHEMVIEIPQGLVKFMPPAE